MLYRTIKKSFILLLSLLITFSMFAQEKGPFNRYGQKLIQEENGVYQMANWENFSKKFNLTDTADFFIPYYYIPDKIQPEDYQGCTTQSFVYNQYPTYQLEMEVDIPKNGNGPFSYILYLHGSNGDLSAFVDNSKYLASKIGVAGIRISYAPKGSERAMSLNNIMDAISFIQSKAKQLNLDDKRWGICGGSAGAILGWSVVINTDCKVFVGFNGRYNNMRENPPATITFHGTADNTINCQESVKLVEDVKAKGAIAQCFLSEYCPHAFFHRGKSDRYEPCLLQMCEFVKANI
jgi:acetyl esterase/lipase